MITDNVLKSSAEGLTLSAKEGSMATMDKKPQPKQTVLSTRQLRMRITCDDPLYRGMKKIKLSGKELSNLPPSLFNLTELQVLDLSPEREACLFYHLVTIPVEIAKLSNLTILALDTNKLESLPEELCHLYSLERLALSNNQLTDLPAALPHLHNLRSLYCSNNKFDHLPAGVCQLKTLAFLDFSDNFLTDLPTDIGSMDSLESLVLSYNKIQSLPESICNLKTLQMLWLCGNCLTALPRGLGKLINLDWSHLMLTSALDGNPLEYPPLSVAKQGPEAIDKFLSLHQSNSYKGDKSLSGKSLQK